MLDFIYFRELKERSSTFLLRLLEIFIIISFFLRLYMFVFILACFHIILSKNDFRKSAFNYILFQDNYLRILQDSLEVFRINYSDIKDCYVLRDISSESEYDDAIYDKLFIVGKDECYTARLANENAYFQYNDSSSFYKDTKSIPDHIKERIVK